jgi:hypothetical protein
MGLVVVPYIKRSTSLAAWGNGVVSGKLQVALRFVQVHVRMSRDFEAILCLKRRPFRLGI